MPLLNISPRIELYSNTMLFISANTILWEEFEEDTKGVIKIRKSKNRQHNGEKKKNKGQTTIYKACT